MFKGLTLGSREGAALVVKTMDGLPYPRNKESEGMAVAVSGLLSKAFSRGIDKGLDMVSADYTKQLPPQERDAWTKKINKDVGRSLISLADGFLRTTSTQLAGVNFRVRREVLARGILDGLEHFNTFRLTEGRKYWPGMPNRGTIARISPIDAEGILRRCALLARYHPFELDMISWSCLQPYGLYLTRNIPTICAVMYTNKDMVNFKYATDSALPEAGQEVMFGNAMPVVTRGKVGHNYSEVPYLHCFTLETRRDSKRHHSWLSAFRATLVDVKEDVGTIYLGELERNFLSDYNKDTTLVPDPDNEIAMYEMIHKNPDVRITGRFSLGDLPRDGGLGMSSSIFLLRATCAYVLAAEIVSELRRYDSNLTKLASTCHWGKVQEVEMLRQHFYPCASGELLLPEFMTEFNRTRPPKVARRETLTQEEEAQGLNVFTMLDTGKGILPEATGRCYMDGDHVWVPAHEVKMSERNARSALAQKDPRQAHRDVAVFDKIRLQDGKSRTYSITVAMTASEIEATKLAYPWVKISDLEALAGHTISGVSEAFVLMDGAEYTKDLTEKPDAEGEIYLTNSERTIRKTVRRHDFEASAMLRLTTTSGATFDIPELTFLSHARIRFLPMIIDSSGYNGMVNPDALRGFEHAYTLPEERSAPTEEHPEGELIQARQTKFGVRWDFSSAARVWSGKGRTHGRR